MGVARERFRVHVAEAARDWRLGCVTVRRNWCTEREIIQICIGEIAADRLLLVCLPLLGTLGAIEEKIGRLAKACGSTASPDKYGRRWITR